MTIIDPECVLLGRTIIMKYAVATGEEINVIGMTAVVSVPNPEQVRRETANRGFGAIIGTQT
jgi:hypothetical protein